MDVTCDNCKAEYDFDDTLLGDKGTTVKCSKCGHVFRVMPPRREPTRSALKVRFHDGRVESVGSLRDLQQRIQAGQVGFDDELGRDGFNYRRLGDVPELRNFFGRSAPTSGPVPSATPSAAKNDLPHRGEPIPAKPAPKRTVLGMGAADIPGAPRVPNFGPLAATALAPTQPAAATPKGTLQGRAPISSAPTAPNMAIPPRDAKSSPYAPISDAPTPTGSIPTATHSALTHKAGPAYAASAAPPSATAATQIAPAVNGGAARAGGLAASPPAAQPANTPASASVDATLARPAADGTPVRAVDPRGSAREPNLTGGSAAPVAQRPAGPALRISESVSEGPMRSDGPHSPRSPGLDSIAPGALKAASLPQSGAPRAGAGKAVRLSLEEEDALPEHERRSGGSRLWLYIGAAVVLGGGALVLARTLGGAPTSAALTNAPVETAAAPAATGAADAALAAVDTTTPAAPAPVAEAKPAEPAPQAPAPTPAPAANDKPASTPKTEASAPSKSASDKPSASEGSASTREPKDYSGWVGRGEQLLAKRDLAGAQQAFQTAVSLRGTGSEANSGLGVALLGQGQTREAVPYLARAASNGFAEASVSLGDAYRKLGDKDNAIEAYETYLARLPKGARASYVKLQLEGLGKDVAGAKPETAPARESEPRVAPSSEYRPAGEANEPAPAPAAENPQ